MRSQPTTDTSYEARYFRENFRKEPEMYTVMGIDNGQTTQLNSFVSLSRAMRYAVEAVRDHDWFGAYILKAGKIAVSVDSIDAIAYGW